MKTETVCKGVELCTYKTDDFKTAQASVNIAMPLDDGNNAARALLIYLISKTDRDYPTIKEMTDRLSMLYGASISGSVVKSGESQVIRLTLECIDDKFALTDESIILDSLSLMFDMIFSPNVEGSSFKDEDIKREKRLMIERIRSMNDDKITYAANRLIEEMCKDEAYSIRKYGTEEEIEALTGEDISKALIDVLLHAPIQINVIGGFDEDSVRKLVSDRFSKLERGDITELRTQFLSEAYDEREIREKQEVNQCKLVIGMRAGMTYDRDNYAALKVMTDIFGSGTYSKLFMNVREKQSLCYYCSAKLDSSKGIILIQSGVEKENIDKAVKAIKHEFEDMRNGNFDEEVINSSKLSLCDGLAGALDTPEDIDIWYAVQQTASCVYSPRELSDMIKQVTKEEIMTAASFASFDTVYILEN
ncbi:MAG: EF-P 5-aminopentanol modification-associated protein YfmF [Acutalibacteraceae bacterium]|nr:pitrilysin family protein [Oscillospiraceae bacterium]